MHDGTPVGFSEALLARVGGDRQVFGELCDLFLDDAPKRLAVIRDAVEAGDARALLAAAHAYKGSAAVFDAHQVVTLTRRLEEIARTGDLLQAPAVFTVLEAVSRDLLAEIAAERAGA